MDAPEELGRYRRELTEACAPEDVGLQSQLLRRRAHALHRPHVLVVDEAGYLTYGTDAANMLFHVVNEHHKRRRSMIFTTNN